VRAGRGSAEETRAREGRNKEEPHNAQRTYLNHHTEITSRDKRGSSNTVKNGIRTCATQSQKTSEGQSISQARLPSSRKRKQSQVHSPESTGIMHQHAAITHTQPPCHTKRNNMSFSHDSRPVMHTHHIDDGSRFKVLEDHTKKQKPKVCRQGKEISNAPKKPPDIQPATHQRTTHTGRYGARKTSTSPEFEAARHKRENTQEAHQHGRPAGENQTQAHTHRVKGEWKCVAGHASFSRRQTDRQTDRQPEW
jgi:hypothetical protein